MKKIALISASLSAFVLMEKAAAVTETTVELGMRVGGDLILNVTPSSNKIEISALPDENGKYDLNDPNLTIFRNTEGNKHAISFVANAPIQNYKVKVTNMWGRTGQYSFVFSNRGLDGTGTSKKGLTGVLFSLTNGNYTTAPAAGDTSTTPGNDNLLRADDFLNDANAAGTTSIAQGGTLDYYIYFASDDNGYAGSGTTGFVTGELYTSILTFTFEPPDT